MNLKVVIIASLMAMTIAYGATPDDIVGEVSMIRDDVFTQESAEAADATATATIMAIVDLKAYSVAAAATDYFKNADDKQKNALLALIGEFSAKAPKDDIITQYGLVMGKLMKKARGMFAYILGNINDEILSGDSVIISATDPEGGTRYSVSSDGIGVQDKPEYLSKLSLSAPVFINIKDKERTGTGGKAISAWIKSGTATIYDKCVKTTMQKNAMKQANDDKECAEACAKVIHTEFIKISSDDETEADKQKTVQDLSSTCRSGDWVGKSPASCSTTPPSAASVRTTCKASATDEMLAKAKQVSMSTIEEHIEAEAMAKATVKDEEEADKEKADLDAAHDAACKDPKYPHKHASIDICYNQHGWDAGGKTGTAPCLSAAEVSNWCNIPGGSSTLDHTCTQLQVRFRPTTCVFPAKK